MTVPATRRPRPRPRLARVLAVVGALFLVLNAIGWWSATEVSDADRFAATATTALEKPEVRDYVAQQIVNATAGDSVVSTTARPLITVVVEEVIKSSAFEGLFRNSVRTLHENLISNRDSSVVVSLADAAPVLNGVLEKLPDGSPISAAAASALKVTIVAADNPAVVALSRIAALGYWFPLVSLLLAALSFAGAVALSADRRAALASIGRAVVVVAALFAGLLLLLAAALAAVISDPGAQAFALGIANAFAAPLRTYVAVMLLLGAAVTIAATSRGEGLPERYAAVRAAWPRWWERGWVRVTTWLVLAVLGGVALRQPAAVGVGLVWVGALGLTLLALTEVRDMLGRRLAGPAGPDGPVDAPVGAVRGLRSAALTGVVAVVVLVAAGGLGIAALTRSDGPAPNPDVAGCNGNVALCDLRLDQVALAGSHNAMSSAAYPGFLYTEQTTTIASQMAFGIRGLLLDTYNAYERDGKLRTVTESGTDLEAVRAEYGPKAADAVARLDTNLGTRPPPGAKVEPYLCHIACEIGALPLVRSLGEIRDFAVQNPNDVLVLILQDYISPQETQKAFEHSGLMERVWPVRVGDPAPTLRQMVERGRNVVAMSENHGGVLDWYPDVYALTEETPFTFAQVAQLNCEPNRGPKSGAPYFLLNHWLRQGVAPSVAVAAKVNTAAVLDRRIEQCKQKRGRYPTMVAVDFAEVGDLVPVIADLNARIARETDRG
jgi:hypothetical protein